MNKQPNMKHIFCVLSLLVSIAATAQLNMDSLRRQYNQKTLKLDNGITMNGFMLGKTEVQNLMLISPEATQSYKLYLKNKKTGTVLPFIGLAAVVGGIVLSKDNRTPGLILILGGNTINIVASVFRRIAGNHLHHAIWTYNRDILFQVK